MGTKRLLFGAMITGFVALAVCVALAVQLAGHLPLVGAGSGGGV